MRGGESTSPVGDAGRHAHWEGGDDTLIGVTDSTSGRGTGND